jgi:hypothetical protein
MIGSEAINESRETGNSWDIAESATVAYCQHMLQYALFVTR